MIFEICRSHLQMAIEFEPVLDLSPSGDGSYMEQNHDL